MRDYEKLQRIKRQVAELIERQTLKLYSPNTPRGMIDFERGGLYYLHTVSRLIEEVENSRG